MIYSVNSAEFRSFLAVRSRLGTGDPHRGMALLERFPKELLNCLRRGRQLGESQLAKGMVVSTRTAPNGYTNGFIHGVASTLGSESFPRDPNGLNDSHTNLEEDAYRAFSFGVYEGVKSILRPWDTVLEAVIEESPAYTGARYSGRRHGGVQAVLAHSCRLSSD